MLWATQWAGFTTNGNDILHMYMCVRATQSGAFHTRNGFCYKLDKTGVWNQHMFIQTTNIVSTTTNSNNNFFQHSNNNYFSQQQQPVTTTNFSTRAINNKMKKVNNKMQ